MLLVLTVQAANKKKRGEESATPPSDVVVDDDGDGVAPQHGANDEADSGDDNSDGVVLASSPSESDIVEAAHIISPWRVDTPLALKNEIIAAEAALAMRAKVDGPPAVYDSPSVSIALRKVSPEVLANEWVELKAPDGGEVKIPPGAKQRHGGPVTVTITSYHTAGRIKELPGRVKYGAGRKSNFISESGESVTPPEEDRVDFFLMKEAKDDEPARHSVAWTGTVDVKQWDRSKATDNVKNGYEHGLGVSVPAHDREDLPGVGDGNFPEEKQAVQMEVEGLIGVAKSERHRGYRKLARRWHPDKNPDDKERATEVFAYLQELMATLFEGPS